MKYLKPSINENTQGIESLLIINFVYVEFPFLVILTIVPLKIQFTKDNDILLIIYTD